jgi:hypothetical protein
MFKLTKSMIISTGAALALLVAAPVAADATTLYVSPTPSAPGTGCAHAGFSEVQTAITEATTLPGPATVELCGGTYAEQLQITHEVTILGKTGAKITLPAVVKNATTSCDTTIDGVVSQPDQDLISICGPGKVTISGLTLEAQWPENTCYGSLYNTMVGGGATLDATKDTFLNAGVTSSSPDVGCQGGVAVQVGFSGTEGSATLDTPAIEIGHATLTDDSIIEYQKNGVTVDGDGSNATIGPKVTIVGDGPANIGQNGIQVSRGAVAKISKVNISNNECNIPNTCGDETASQWEEDASGVLLYLPGARTALETSKLSANNIGVEYISGAETRPGSPELALSKDQVSGGYASVQINQGNAVMEHDTFSGAVYGIDVNENEYGGSFGTPNAYAPKAASSHDAVSGTKGSVQVEESVGALEGELSLLNDHIVGPVLNNGSAFKVIG